MFSYLNTLPIRRMVMKRVRRPRRTKPSNDEHLFNWRGLYLLLAGAVVTVPFVVFGPSAIMVTIGAQDPRTLRTDHGMSPRELESMYSVVQQAKDLIANGQAVSQAHGDSKRGESSHHGSRDLCIGMAQGLTANQLVTFVASFREVAPSARLVIFIDSPTSGRHREIINKFKVSALQFGVEELEPEYLRQYHPSSTRWILIHRFLEDQQDNYDRVLMADVRDTVFQSNPFDIIGEPGLYTFNGVEGKTIGQCGWNGGWVRDCFGEEVLSEIRDNPIVCSGVSLGTTEHVLVYAQQMSKHLLSRRFQRCERNGVDQGLHNYLLHTDNVRGVIRFDQSNGPVANMQADKYKLHGTRVANKAGREVPIVHQYDRNKRLMEALFEKYAFWREDRGVKGEGGRGSCGAYTIQNGVDLFKAKCDLTAVGIQTLDGCCTACDNKGHACRAFSFAKKSAMCYMKTCNNPDPAERAEAMPAVTSGYKQ